MTNFELTFSPLIPLSLLLVLGAGAILVLGLGAFARAKGTLLRAAALTFLLIALAGPSLDKETRSPLNDVVAVVVDRSASQQTPARIAATDQALDQVKQRLKVPGIDLRVVEATQAPDEDGTHLFAPLQEAIKDVPADRLGGGRPFD